MDMELTSRPLKLVEQVHKENNYRSTRRYLSCGERCKRYRMDQCAEVRSQVEETSRLNIIRPRLRLEIPALEDQSITSSGLLRTPSSGKSGNKCKLQNTPTSSSRVDHRLNRSLSLNIRSSGIIEPKIKKQVQRSISGPMDGELKDKSLTRVYSGTYLVKPATPRPEKQEGDEESTSQISGEDLICRICLCDLTLDTAKTLKLECSCKGGLALVHHDCALKWFGIRGNRDCDVCGNEVVNLPVTVISVQISPENHDQVNDQPHQPSMLGPRLWLFTISTVAYFCFLEQLLISEKGHEALILSLPFAVLFGLITSITASLLGKHQLIWLSSAVQICLVILFTRMLYTWVKLEPVLSIALAGIGGFGMSMGLNILTSVRAQRSVIDQPDVDVEQGRASY